MRLAALVPAMLLATVVGAQPNPMDPKGFNPPKGPTYALPPPDPKLKDEHTIHWKTAGHVTQVEHHVTATKGVEFQYRGYNVKADDVDGDTDSQQFTLRGNVVLRGVDQVTSGREVWVDFKNKKYRMNEGRTDLTPKFLQGKVLSDVFGKAGRGEGTDNHAELFDGAITTCPIAEHPHFAFEANEIDATAGERIIFRKVRFRVLGKTILSLPYFSMPLDKPEYNGYLPQMGHSDLEGFYAKSRFEVATLHKRGTARVELMEKRGLGLGIERLWKDRKSNGSFHFYNLYDNRQRQNTMTGDASHSEIFGKLALDTRFDLRQNSYLNSPDTRTMDANVGMRYSDRTSSPQLSFQETKTDSGTYSSTNSSIGLSDSVRLKSGFTTTTRVAYSDSSTSSAGSVLSEMRQMDLNMGVGYMDQRNRFDGDLAYQRLIPVGSTTNFRSGTERTPVLSLRSDSRRLFRRKAWPLVSLDSSVGQFLDGYTNTRVTRESIGFRSNRSTGAGKGLSLGYDSNFSQAFYSDNTAQYILGQTVETRYGVSAKEYSQGLVLRYQYLRPYGFTPLSVDRRGETNVASTMWEVPFRHVFTMRTGTGYDFLQAKQGNTPWNSVGTALRYHPAKYLDSVLTSTYDTYNKVWQTTRFRLNWKPGATIVSTEARYDGSLHTWGAANLRLEGLKVGRFKLSTLLLYNGYLKRFDSQQFQAIYDLHCMEAVLTYRDTPYGFQSRKSIDFAIRIKALPYKSDFGLGNSGEPLDTGTGVDF